jgi:CubicO group peptidase (beta-lactamase class C family)
MKEIFPVLLVLIFALKTIAQIPCSPTDFTAFEQTVQEEMKQKRVPGAAVAIVCGDRIVYQKAFGVGNIETNVPLTTEMLFRLGSTTKMFVALAAVTMAERGKIDLHVPIGKYARGLHPKIAALTLHQTLSHTAGLRDDAPQYGPLDETALAERVTSWNEKAFFAEPNTIFSYSNPGYVLASYVLEQAANKPFADLMNELVFQPLAMKRSTFRPLMALTYPLTLGHSGSPAGIAIVRPFAENAANWAPGSLFSNVEELSRFLLAFLNGGNLAGEQKLSAGSLRTLIQPKAEIVALNRKYGYGLVSFTEDGVPVVMHTGGRSGYGSIIWTVPEKRFGIVVLANNTAVFSNSARFATALFIKTTPDTRAERKPVPLNAEEIKKYEGRYVNSESIQVELFSQEQKLMLRLGARTFPVVKIGENRFQAAGAGPLSEFLIINGTNGQPEFLIAENWALRRQTN